MIEVTRVDEWFYPNSTGYSIYEFSFQDIDQRVILWWPCSAMAL